MDVVGQKEDLGRVQANVGSDLGVAVSFHLLTDCGIIVTRKVLNRLKKKAKEC